MIAKISYKKLGGDGLCAVPKLDETELVPPLFSYRRRFLAFAGTEVIQSGATNAALLFHFHLRDPRRMQWENALDTFAVGNSADCKHFV